MFGSLIRFAVRSVLLTLATHLILKKFGVKPVQRR